MNITSLGVTSVTRLRTLMKKLRDPNTGGPWDRAQTFNTIAPYTIEEAYEADEAFATSASGFTNPIVKIDGNEIGTGKPGPVGDRLRELYIAENLKAAV